MLHSTPKINDSQLQRVIFILPILNIHNQIIQDQILALRIPNYFYTNRHISLQVNIQNISLKFKYFKVVVSFVFNMIKVILKDSLIFKFLGWIL